MEDPWKIRLFSSGILMMGSNVYISALNIVTPGDTTGQGVFYNALALLRVPFLRKARHCTARPEALRAWAYIEPSQGIPYSKLPRNRTSLPGCSRLQLHNLRLPDSVNHPAGLICLNFGRCADRLMLP